MAHTLQVQSDFGEWTMAIDANRVELMDTGETAVVSELPDSRFDISTGSQNWRMAAARLGQRVWIFVDGYAVEFSVEESTATRPRSVRDQDALTPPMPSTVARVHVQAGQRVAQGDILLVLEAMKMELPVRAPRAGTVKAIRCAEGQLVQPGEALIDLE
jgi:biotin carboxyl carrier protein